MIPLLGEHVIEESHYDGKIHKHLANSGNSTLKLCINNSGEELSTFDVENFADVLDYKWVTFARPIHMFGFLCHIFYISVLTLYV